MKYALVPIGHSVYAKEINKMLSDCYRWSSTMITSV